jgi:hypothetical protein
MIAECLVCGAVCNEKKHEKRFRKRHPALCRERKEFTAQLAKGTRSVDADDWRTHQEEIDARSER